MNFVCSSGVQQDGYKKLLHTIYIKFLFYIIKHAILCVIIVLLNRNYCYSSIEAF
jgi:hypothetical protein